MEPSNNISSAIYFFPKGFSREMEEASNISDINSRVKSLSVIISHIKTNKEIINSNSENIERNKFKELKKQAFFCSVKADAALSSLINKGSLEEGLKPALDKLINDFEEALDSGQVFPARREEVTLALSQLQDIQKNPSAFLRENGKEIMLKIIKQLESRLREVTPPPTVTDVRRIPSEKELDAKLNGLILKFETALEANLVYPANKNDVKWAYNQLKVISETPKDFLKKSRGETLILIEKMESVLLSTLKK